MTEREKHEIAHDTHVVSLQINCKSLPLYGKHGTTQENTTCIGSLFLTMLFVFDVPLSFLSSLFSLLFLSFVSFLNHL